MHAGGIVEMGSPQELYARPAHPFTASFLGEISFISGTAASADGDMVEVLTSCGLLHSLRSERALAGETLGAGGPPEHLRLSPGPPPGPTNRLEGTGGSPLFEGAPVQIRVALGGVTVLGYR